MGKYFYYFLYIITHACKKELLSRFSNNVYWYILFINADLHLLCE